MNFASQDQAYLIKEIHEYDWNVGGRHEPEKDGNEEYGDAKEAQLGETEGKHASSAGD